MSRMVTLFAISTALTTSSAALAGQDIKTSLPGSGIIIGHPIVLHNQLHYSQEARRLSADYRAALARDGGHLSPSDKAALSARYQSLAVRVNRWVAEGDAPTRVVGSNIPRRSVFNKVGHMPISLPLPPSAGEPEAIATPQP